MSLRAQSFAHPPALMTAEHAAAYIGVSVTKLRTAPGMPTARRVPDTRMIRWARADLNAWAVSRPADDKVAAATEQALCDEAFG